MIDLTPMQAEIESLCKTLAIKRLELIGSAARDDFCLARSEELFGRKVDVVQAGAVKNPYVRQTIERDRVLVYGA